MNYLIIHDLESEKSHQIELSKDTLNDFYNAKSVLRKYRDMESIYDLIIEEYWDFKNKVDYWRLRSLSSPSTYIFNYKIRSSLNRLAFNLLNLSKLFLDLHYHESDEKCFSFDITKDEESKNKIIKQREYIYSKNLGYVVACKLRNRMQHTLLPVDSFSTVVRYEAHKKPKVSFEVTYSHEDLLKIKVPKDMIKSKESLDLNDIFDGYVYAISQMHFLNRELTEKVVSEAKYFIKSLSETHVNSLGYKKFLSEIKLETGESLNTYLDWFDVSEHLLLKHEKLIDYSKISFEK